MNRKPFVIGIFLGLLFLSFMTPSLHAVTSRKDALISFVRACETESGFTDVPSALNGTLESTFHAMYILNVYNRLDDIDTDLVIEFVNQCRNEDHGYGNTIPAESDLISTYYALWIINELDVQLDNDTDEWVATLYNATEGFAVYLHNASAGFSDEDEGSLLATYYGLEALFFNDTNLEDYNLSTWLLERQNTNPVSDGYGGFATDGNTSNIWATWAAMGAIDRLNISGGFLINPLVTWLNGSQNLNIYEEDYGAFSSDPSATDYSLLHTHAAIYCLQTLGDAYLSSINLEAALDGIIGFQNSDGGFRVNSAEGGSSLSASYYAFCTLDLVGETSRLHSDVPWEYGLELPLWAWILIGIAIAITAILVIRKYYMY